MSRPVAAAETTAGERRTWALELPIWAPGLACLAFVALAVAAAYPASSPLVPDHPGGDTRWSWLFIAAAGAAFLAYLGGLRLLERARESRATLVIAVAFAVQLLPLAGPVLVSTDVYTYWDYGRLSAVHGANPYEDTPSEFPGDPAFGLMGPRWYETSTVYGPGFTLASEAHASVVGESDEAAAWLYKTVGALSMAGLVALAARLGRRPALAAAFVGWNPVLALHFAGGGHNDALMMLLLVGALALAASGRRGLAGAAWAASISVKWVPLVLLPLRVLADRAAGRRAEYLGFAAVAALIVAVASWRYGTAWVGAFGPIEDNLRDQSRYSLPNRLVQVTGMPEGAAAGLVLALFAVFYVWLLREARRGRARLGLAAGALLVATTWLVPWYAVWAVPLAAVEEDRAAKWLAVALSAYLLPAYVPL
jgi:alpha-1,6-mannosyltransferase